MENSTFYNTKSINFIKILNKILVGFLIIVVVLIFALRLNDTVSFKDGQIYSDTPQIKINTPNDVKVLRVSVKEGQQVRKGDTLFVLENKKTQSDYNVLNTDLASKENKVKIIKKLIANTTERKNALKRLLSIQAGIYKTDRSKAAAEIEALNNKLSLSSQQTNILTDKYKTDSLLYAKGAISRYEMTDTKNRNLDVKKAQVDNRSVYSVKNFDYQNLHNNYKRSRNDLERSIIDVDNELQGYQRDLVELETEIQDGKYTMNYMSDELNKLVVISPVEGTISNLYNSRQNVEILAKGDLLGIIAPKKENFYAKVTLNEKDLAYIKNGQEINLKLDAYNYYRFGAIKGKITYVSPSDVDRTFYCLAVIKKYNPNITLKAGYKLKGEVIIERMQLYQYIIKKLFNKIDNNMN
ncbi:HlyD family efflux transporter periplasmic adaptor subunit [Flavobacterium sp. CYK-55]|uniref:HlyD family secretion protein n=1 Tax=Flavobacterium sp. CYK-55 TaxID=2835529 RepID=UPI001BCDFCA5|nr:HlyD family efflux transporter periplasmic adaptor subunit [Flavobacterium sp. CYK-55]MBS7787753.1 HlyD family efflux transporter periplasmic adaptor subunit [Flavobacterium sp. CYK-55]